jgi:2-C-methyl-D-erythritol 2,4-cyclodiphosphate synthase
MDYRTGFGIDIHKFADNRKLIIGGIEIPYERGLLGHSDADILLHAIADALLGSLALGDIGIIFPDTDEKNKDIDSRIILKKAYDMVQEAGYILGNLDTMITAEKPKLSSYIPRMKDEISKVLECSPGQVSIKATTTEKMGFIGREEGITAFASVLVIKKDL